MADYWNKRATEDEEKAQALAASYSKRQEKAYIEAYREIDKRIDALYAEIASKPYGEENITRSQLWQYKKYIDLRNQIEQQVSGLSHIQNNLVEWCIDDVFERTMEMKLDELGASYSTIGREQMKQVLNTNWSGENYSQRIWKNANNLATRLNKDIADMICLGKNPEQIKAAIMEDFNISYNVADRLIRTESSYTYNSAAIESYKAAGVDEVEFIAESDCCAQCEEYRGKTFPIQNAPMLPIHPNCRCCYAPVIDLSEKIQYDNNEKQKIVGFISGDNQSIREQYYEKVSNIPNMIDKSKPIEEQAIQAYNLRNEIRSNARAAMLDRALANKLNSNNPALSFEELINKKMVKYGFNREQAIVDILRSASTTNKDVDDLFGIGRRKK